MAIQRPTRIDGPKLKREKNSIFWLGTTTGSGGWEMWVEPSPSPCSLTHQPNSVNESSEDSYVMQMLTSPASVVQQQQQQAAAGSSSSPVTSLNHPTGHRHLTPSSAGPVTVAISPEEVAMRMLDYYTVHMLLIFLFQNLFHDAI
jgi:hypothetical protein